MTELEKLADAVCLIQYSHPRAFEVMVSLPDLLEISVSSDLVKQAILELLTAEIQQRIAEKTAEIDYSVSPGHQPPPTLPSRLRIYADGETDKN